MLKLDLVNLLKIHHCRLQTYTRRIRRRRRRKKTKLKLQLRVKSKMLDPVFLLNIYDLEDRLGAAERQN